MIARQTAIPCTLADIRDGQWVPQADLPSGVLTPRGLLSRVHVIGVIVEKQPQGFTLEDGTARLHVRVFEAPPRETPDVGAVVAVIGKPREYNGEKYLALEICKRRAFAWVEYRRKELALSAPAAPVRIVREAPQTVAVASVEKNPFELMVDRIRKLDDGKGADVQELLEGIAHPDKEKLLQSLLEEGEVFELRPGRVKVLE